MTRTLLLTNDFPPRPGGIQSYLQNLVDLLPPEDVVVYAPRWRGDSHEKFDAAAAYRVYRHPTTLMLPTPFVARRAAEIVRREQISTVWFGAAAPLAVLAPAMRRAGAQRIIASTHGHEVGWSMLPGARQVLGHIGRHSDVITFVSRYTRGRFASAFGARAALEHLPPGVDTERFAPDPVLRQQFRDRLDLGERPTILCLSRLVPRKGQDVLIRALPLIRRTIPDAALVIVGGGPYAKTLRDLAADTGVAGDVVFTGSVPADELAAYHNIADVFAMPSRTRGRGLDVEGLGIVYLEASASGVPVVAGLSGGAPETIDEGVTGTAVDGTDVDAVALAILSILSDRAAAAEMGRAGRRYVVENWQWSQMAARLRQLL
ncbi:MULTISPECIES: glycosyltransferase family 4 protein [Gordonia]|uniref:phosphatidyl-myo-inositol dimannoside synthase n=1 Tax=Gordonia terrae TaxID=2055 RepID=A0AAD0K7N1_9ACTN|nr:MULTISPECIES: glycosyltransferase family 4 protein [Gordonia]ANY24028.1 alpha-(1-2)-phosphatidylinositol mannosyltransferase [Gordonia terrae]AWO84768.1 glycosyltransferase family 1 protein [Gordonia terrae]VTR07500.1 glycosyltransferase [Clostridioides difficile]VTS56586.1 GDP-mannose-dependent alpha-(1-6)-phosphatidylinositol monomannoside mannosyltransferase [Gordonia terrae]